MSFSGPKPADADARERIVASRGRNFLVEAGAGTGKTKLMVDRIVGLIEEGLSVSRIAAITFTERAAGEMKARLRSRLMERISQVRDRDLSRRLRDSLAQVESAAICTIHSFAAGLIRERPVESGIAPGFEILEEGDDFIRELWETWRSESMLAEPDRWRILLRFFRVENRYDALWNLAASLLPNRDLLPKTGDAPAYPDAGLHLDRVRDAAARHIEHAKRHCENREDRLWTNYYRDLAPGLEKVGLAEADERFFELYDFQCDSSRGRKGAKKNWSTPESLDAARSGREEINDLLKEYRAALLGAVLGDAIGLIAKFALVLHREKLRKGVLEFQDLLLLARDMLAGSPQGREDFQKRYRHILVDEFQDTDALQSEILLLLTRIDPKEDLFAPGDLVPGKLFIVGDPKQSIYRFRRADIEIYHGIKEIFLADENSAVEEISVNFRCADPILDWVNEVFGAAMSAESDPKIQAPYVDLVPFPREEIPSGQGVRFLAPEKALDKDIKIDELRGQEAKSVAQAIRELVEGGRTQVLEPESKEIVEARYRHIAVLYPRKTGIGALEDALRFEQIPFVSDGGKDFYQDPNVHNLLYVLRALEYPHDGIAVAAALTGPFFAFSDEELVKFHTSAGKLDYRDPPEEALKAVPGLKESMDFLRELHGERNRIPAWRTIERLFMETHALPFALSFFRKPGERVASLLSMTRDRARLIQQSRLLSFGEILSVLEGEREANLDLAEFAEPDVEGDQVQLLTCHKSKGLEFPIVFLVNLCSEIGGKDKPIPQRLQKKIAVSIKDMNGREMKTPGYDEAKALEDRKEKAEDIRLLYVAATRARDHLVISCFGKSYSPEAPCSFLELIPGLKWVFEEGEDEKKRVFRPAPPKTDPNRMEESRRSGESLPSGEGPDMSRLLEDCNRRLSSLLGAGSRVSRRRPSRSEKEGGFAGSEGSRREPEGRVLGIAFHELMEICVLADEEDITLSAKSVARKHRIPEAGDTLAKWAFQALDTEMGRRIRRAGDSDILREVPFAHQDEEGEVREGVIDLLLREDGEWTIVDYKTDQAAPDELPALAENYRPQIAAYAKAVEKITGRPLHEAHIIFARHGLSLKLL